MKPFCLKLCFKLKQLCSLNSSIAVLPLQWMVSGVLGCRGVPAARLVGKALRHGWGSAITPLLPMADRTVRALMHRCRFAAGDTAQVRCIRCIENNNKLVTSFPNSTHLISKAFQFWKYKIHFKPFFFHWPLSLSLASLCRHYTAGFFSWPVSLPSRCHCAKAALNPWQLNYRFHKCFFFQIFLGSVIHLPFSSTFQ